MRVALALEYAGHAFCGFQSQVAGCGVQDTLARALAKVADHPVRIVAAGRTDACVHASSQIVHFDTEAARPETAWVRGVNAHLPPAVSVLWASPVAEDFHARFAATARHYSYLLLTRPQRPGLFAPYVGWYHAPLDIGAMREGARHLAGTHDFSSFRAAECQAKSPVKTLTRVTIEQQQAYLRFEFSADAFLHHMIRNLVGALVAVGMGKYPPSWLAVLLAARDRTRAPATFAAAGLYFVGADYDPRFALPPTVRRVPLPAV